MDKVEIMALMDSVLGWDLSSRDRREPPPETVEAALKQLAQHAVSLGRDLDAHIRALPRGDDVRRPAAVTLEEASRRLQATARSQGGALRAHNLARLVQALTAVSVDAERRIHELLAARATASEAPAGERGWP
ncbi:hypothetical protein AR457_00205 [Streptomyces agglomeratus]|uniref:DUF6415 family natural product biosynthesis protein n=1 Tax=Streptomyces agglomeratus TaxID=285458 RepID=UPI000854E7CF|nr:DUF6415 family natural product biosynthesis protein [Streptomyces agglomeratus]OEJ42779.1 hypothetical protein AR457_00205 [Streptomyces agglomeratus]